MKNYTINLFIDSVSIFLYYIVQGFGLLFLNFLSFFTFWSPKLRKKFKRLNDNIVKWFDDRMCG